MTLRILFTPDPTRMSGWLTEVPELPGEGFYVNIPEAIGDSSQVVWTTDLAAAWTDLGAGRWRTQLHVAGELDFVLTLTPAYDTVDIDVSLTNLSPRTWTDSMAFHCFNCGGSPSIGDYECARHWVRTSGHYRRLIEMPRVYSHRPTVQLYNVEYAPPAMQIPFVASFDATPAVVLERWLAIRSRDGHCLAAAVSRPALFLFQNMEFSCIHAAPGFGTLQPGEAGEARTRLYLVRSSLQDWHTRMKEEMGP
jgi:hypothetical protein